MSLKAREAKVHCVKHPFANNSHKTKECNTPLRRPCSCGSTDHHQLLCPKLKISSHVAITAKSSKGNTKIEVLLKTMFIRGAKGNQNYDPSLVKCHVGRLIVLHTAEEASEALVD